MLIKSIITAVLNHWKLVHCPRNGKVRYTFE